MGSKDNRKAYGALTREIISGLLEQSFTDIECESFSIKDLHNGTNLSLRLQLEYIRGNGPHSVFIKVANKLSSRLALRALGALYTEAQLAKAKTYLPFRHPQLYGGFYDKRKLYSLLAEEDIANSGTCHTPLETLSIEEIRSGLGELAKLHASRWGLPVKEDFIRPWQLKKSLAKVSSLNMVRSFRMLDNMDTALELTKRLNPLKLSREFQEISLIYSQGIQTLLHGDPHIGNTYTTKDNCLGFLDLQLIRYGNWSSDVGYFLISSLSPNLRRQYLEELLRYYLEQLASLSIDVPGFQDAFCAISYTPAFGLASWLHTLAFKIFQKENYCLEMISRFFSAYEDLNTNKLFTKKFIQ